jgi:hypothetical protein
MDTSQKGKAITVQAARALRALSHEATMVAPPRILVALLLAARIFFLATTHATSHESF